MTKKYTVAVSGFCLIDQTGKIQRNAVKMSVSYKDTMPEYSDFIFFWKVGEEIIVSGNDRAGAFCESFYIEFAPFHVSAVDQHIKRLFSQNCGFQIVISSMSVADNKEFH